jgi:hypothetical protein
MQTMFLDVFTAEEVLAVYVIALGLSLYKGYECL